MGIMRLSPDEDAATKWFESMFWSDGRTCPHCGGTNTYEIKNANRMPYRFAVHASGISLSVQGRSCNPHACLYSNGYGLFTWN